MTMTDLEMAPSNTERSRRPTLAQRILSRDALADLPSPDPLIDGVIDLNSVAVLAGGFGTLKSFIALDWAACTSTGFAWRSRAVEPLRVLYVAGEGAYGLHRRLSAWEQYRKTHIPTETLSVLPVPIHLGHPGQMTELTDIVAAGNYGFVIVDTMAKSMVVMDENSAMDMGIAVAALYQVREATGTGSVLALHHTGKDRTTVRGSSALESGVDTVYQTEGDASQITLHRTKRKDGPVEDTHQLSLHLIEGTGSGVILSAQGADMTANARTLMSTFVSTFGTNGATKAELRTVADLAPSSFHRAVSDLVSAGQLTNSGTDKRPFYKAAQ